MCVEWNSFRLFNFVFKLDAGMKKHWTLNEWGWEKFDEKFF